MWDEIKTGLAALVKLLFSKKQAIRLPASKALGNLAVNGESLVVVFSELWLVCYVSICLICFVLGKNKSQILELFTKMAMEDGILKQKIERIV